MFQLKNDFENVKNIVDKIAEIKTAIKKNESSAIAFEFSRKSYEADALKFELGKININELNISKMIFNNSCFLKYCVFIFS